MRKELRILVCKIAAILTFLIDEITLLLERHYLVLVSKNILYPHDIKLNSLLSAEFGPLLTDDLGNLCDLEFWVVLLNHWTDLVHEEKV